MAKEKRIVVGTSQWLTEDGVSAYSQAGRGYGVK
jgi:hypothetical protein